MTSQTILAQSPTVIRIASPDVSAGNKHAGGGVVDVLYVNQWLEKEFAKKNIKIQWLFFKGAGPAINEALANKQVDFAFLGDFPLIIGKAGGLDTQLLLAVGRGSPSYLAVRSDVNIKKLSDLKGKKVGLLRGTADELGFITALNSQGINSREVRIINLDFNAVNAALVAKKIDASWGPARFFALRDKGVVKLPVNSNQLNGAGSMQGGLIGRREFIQIHPLETQQIVNQVVKGLYWLSQEQNRVPQIALFFTQAAYPASVYAQALQATNLKFAYSPLLDPYYLNQLQNKINLAKNQGLIRKNIDVKSWINPSFTNQALNYLQIKNYWQATAQYQSRERK
ncbi:ABC transporter substrate-binding protein [Acinetobacter qingfengensis]|nr:ABC transporter substrate-binding protein [Acinetobacter qingfengensis]